MLICSLLITSSFYTKAIFDKYFKKILFVKEARQFSCQYLLEIPIVPRMYASLPAYECALGMKGLGSLLHLHQDPASFT